ncbi:MAG: hypothetical protein DRP00_02870 [Candidatus Aenigmatarchaeota archaeon]|mgnify:CR=1 FL=1|nr:MAG: hypothetical protein DRP00_02870 [Candidatus Aenigmarchaeota archaeon]
MIVEALISFFDFIFSPFLMLKPHLSLFLVSSLITFLIILINKFCIDKKKVEELKKKMEELRIKVANAQKLGNLEEANKFLNELLKTNTEHLRQSLKALLLTLVLISLVFPWIKYRYGGMSINLPFNLPLIGSSFSWFIWYALVSFTVGWILRKLLGG